MQSLFFSVRPALSLAAAFLALTVHAASAQGPTAEIAGAGMEVAAVPGLGWQRPNLPGGPLPAQAMVVGVDAGRDVFACRVRNGSGLRIGKLRDGTCHVPMNGAEVSFPEFEVLSGAPWLLRWSQGSGRPPATALVAGHADGVAAPLCQVDHMGGVHPGMVLGERCHFGLDGKEIMAVDYRYAEPNPPGQIILRHVTGGWVPPGAVTAATEAGSPGAGAPAVCLADAGGEWLPGMIDAAGLCTHVRTGAVARDGAYTVVIGDPRRVAWVTYEGGALPRWEGPPEYSVRIGGASQSGQPHEICRAQIGGQFVAGRVQGGRCLTPAGSEGFTMVPRYQVLHYIGEVQAAGPRPGVQ